MIEVRNMKVQEGQVITPPSFVFDTLTYREKNYPIREITDGYNTYTVSVERLKQGLLDGIRSFDPVAFDTDRDICYSCTEDEIRTLTDEQLIKIIFS